MFSGWLLPRVSSNSAREKKHQNFRSGLRRMQRRAIFFPARAILQHPLEEDTARAR
jgi:hypothetical protein